jgi:polyhydroxyalkanoate synthase subunit PhaC
MRHGCRSACTPNISRRLFLDNDLAEGRFLVDNQAIALTDIRAPIFAVGTEKDHVAPWRSVFKVHLLTDTEVTFVLTAGGHNGGIVSEPARTGRRYRVLTRRAEERYVDPDTWEKLASVQQGSWWPEWVKWLSSWSGAPVPPPTLGSLQYAPSSAAPGTYVLEP